MNITDYIISHESQVRLGSFFGILFIMCLWEVFAPRRKLSLSKLKRWPSNFAIVFLNTLILRLVFPAAATGMAVYAEQKGWGLFNSIGIPSVITIIASVIILDMIIYWQHVIFHRIPLFWRFHRMHHADLDIDVTTGARFHPGEIIISMLIKFVAIMFLGVPVIAVIVFEVILNAMAMFNHSNAKLPLGLDRILRLFIVTPDMHRVHHSTNPKEYNNNFGFNLSIWDRVFKSYTDQPAKGHAGMVIGLNEFSDEKESDQLPGMLMIPFK